MKHRVFGEKQDVKYTDRKGAYLIAVNDGKIAVVKTSKGLFLLGGGIDGYETDEEAIVRECREEIGYEVVVEKFICSAELYDKHPAIGFFHPIQSYYVGKLLQQVDVPKESDHQLVWYTYTELKGNLYVPMQNWALDVCMHED